MTKKYRLYAAFSVFLLLQLSNFRHRIVEVDHCPITDFEEQLADKTEFAIVGHNLEWYGYCPECRKQK
ncbi:MAG: hypothetical protein ACLUUD_01125 [Phascolarctobacterium succinatutens]|uniref:hypothetical protein n=1 Tax=Phascolarctobacterium succinatutens TaxID=626940 RepID=UPI0039940C14